MMNRNVADIANVAERGEWRVEEEGEQRAVMMKICEKSKQFDESSPRQADIRTFTLKIGWNVLGRHEND